MLEVARLRVLADITLISLINSGLGGFCNYIGMSDDHAGRLQLAVEEVFAYCVETITSAGDPSRITLRLAYDRTQMRIGIEHSGPRGELDRYIKNRSLQKVEKKTFRALGMHIACEVMHTLRYDYWPREKINRFIMTQSIEHHNLSERAESALTEQGQPEEDKA